MVIAPAGFGKTYTIAECVASYRGEKQVLVLTHTHAGIASLKEKFQLKNIPFCHRACNKNTESTTHKKVFSYKI